MVSRDPASPSPGTLARERGLLRAWLPFAGLAAASGFLIGAVWSPDFLRGTRGLWAFLPVAAASVWAWCRAKGILERHERGARGEERVAEALAALPDTWRLFHGVPFGDGDLDHVLLGPAGLVVVETIRWNGRVELREGRLWDGDEAYPGYEAERLIERSRRFARSLEAEDAPVHTLVAVAGGRLVSRTGNHDGLWLTEVEDLLELVKQLPAEYDAYRSLIPTLEALYDEPT